MPEEKSPIASSDEVGSSDPVNDASHKAIDTSDSAAAADEIALKLIEILIAKFREQVVSFHF
jgi:hypothetical protein